MSCEDEHTQTSSPGGWQAKLQALNFLNLQASEMGLMCKLEDSLILSKNVKLSSSHRVINVVVLQPQ